MEFLLRKNTLLKYNINACKDIVVEILSAYIEAKYLDYRIKKLGEDYYDSSATSNLTERLEMFTLNYSDRVGNKVMFKIDNQKEKERLDKDIEDLRVKLTDQEKDYFDLVLLGKQPQRVLEDKYKLTQTGFTPIRESCIVKSAIHFNVAVMKKI